MLTFEENDRDNKRIKMGNGRGIWICGLYVEKIGWDGGCVEDVGWLEDEWFFCGEWEDEKEILLHWLFFYIFRQIRGKGWGYVWQSYQQKYVNK